MTMEIEQLGSALGARIHGVNLADELSNETVDAIHSALAVNKFIVFPDQQLQPEDHLAFGRRFGSLNVHPHVEHLRGYPEILNIVKEPTQKANFGGGWHTDMTFLPEPPLGSILYARELPNCGGDTLFANMVMAFETLSAGMRRMLEGMTAIHSASNIYGEQGIYASPEHPAKNLEVEAANAECEHPVVRTHPQTGEKILFVNPAFTLRFKDMTRAESRPILNYLYDHAGKPEFVYRHQWRVNDVGFWDNRSTQHYALNDYQGQRRVMHRVTVNGDKPF